VAKILGVVIDGINHHVGDFWLAQVERAAPRLIQQ
jgi:hypothetical protein